MGRSVVKAKANTGGSRVVVQVLRTLDVRIQLARVAFSATTSSEEDTMARCV